MISEKSLVTDGSSTIYSVGFEIISDDHCNVLIDNVLQSSDTYDIINNAVVFHSSPTTGLNLMVRVGTTVTDLVAAPTDIGIVATDILDVNTVSTNISTIVDVANNISNILVASTSATEAASSASAALISEGASKSSENASASSETASAVSEGNASLSEINAAASLAAAIIAKDAAEVAADSFDDTYLGAKGSDPTTDNDGDALDAGDMFYLTTTNKMRIYNGTNFEDVSVDPATMVNKTSSIGSLIIPKGTTAQRDANPATGYTRFNTDTSSNEVWDGTAWVTIGSSNSVEDADGNTYVRAEVTNNEDKIRLGTAGTDRILIDATGISVMEVDGTTVAYKLPLVGATREGQALLSDVNGNFVVQDVKHEAVEDFILLGLEIV